MALQLSRSVTTIRILAINDVYELSNLPRLLTLKKQLNPLPDAFVVAGDFLSPSVLSSIDQGHGIVDMFNAIGVTHVCFGNHEADLALEVIKRRIKESKFVWLNTNIPTFFHDDSSITKTISINSHDKGCQATKSSGHNFKDTHQMHHSNQPITIKTTKKKFPMKESSIVTSKCGKVSIELLGLMSDESDMFRDGTFKGLEIESTVEHIKQAYDCLQTSKQTDSGVSNALLPTCLVPLTHQSMKGDRKMAEKCAALNIDLPLVIGGHDHIPMIEKHAKSPVTHNGGTMVVKTGSDAVHAGVIDLQFAEATNCSDNHEPANTATMELKQVEVSLLDVKHFKSDLPAKARMKRHLSVISNLQDYPLASLDLLQDELAAIGVPSDVLLSSEKSRFRQTSVGALLAYAVKEELQADVCVINGATIKGDTAYDGKVITFRELKEELPFPTKMISVNLPGTVLQAAIRYSRTHGPDGQERRGYLQVDSGVIIPGQYRWLADTASSSSNTSTVQSSSSNTQPMIHPNSDLCKIKTIGGKPFSESEIYNVAIPRNLLNGFCSILPLVEWAKKEKLKQTIAQSLIDQYDSTEVVTELMVDNAWIQYATSTHSEKHGDGVDNDLKDLHQEKLVAASRAIPSEDAFIPAFNLVLAFFTKAHWRGLASSFTFDDLDRDRDGCVDRHEIALAYAKKYGLAMPPMLLDSMMKTLDQNGDDAIDRAEFEALNKTHPRQEIGEPFFFQN